MCGIAGYYGNSLILEDALNLCLSLMKRRGPDHQSYQQMEHDDGRKLYLLHSRLNIIDLDHRSDQPFRIGSKWMVFNGELYNYRELKQNLESEKVSFYTKSDTEVFLAALNHWGEKALDKCEGMWSFALYDEQTGILTLCRDRFGEKPLYIMNVDDGIYFGSEIKFIQALSGKAITVNEQQILRYLVNGYKSLYKSEETFFNEVFEVKPASFIKIFPDGKKGDSKYWKPTLNIDDGMSYKEAVIGVKERLIRSVELRLRSDVPLAFCMSGGVDSNSLISIAKRIFNFDVHGFTIVNTDTRYDEKDLVEYAVRELGIRHTSVFLSVDNFLEQLAKLIKYHDAPVYTITYYAQWLLLKEIAHQGYRVSVSGTGADEIFSGYYDHHLFYLKEISDIEDLFKISKDAWAKYILPIVRNPFLGDPDLFIRNPSFRDHIYLDANEFRTYLLRTFDEPFNEIIYTSDLLRNRMMNEMFHETVPVILHDDDLNAMYYSVENRSPFLDKSLYEFSMRVPTRHLIRDGTAKALLRDAMRGIVPDKILDERRKVGFNAPIYDFLDRCSDDVRRELMRCGPVFSVINQNSIKEMLDRDFLPNSESKFLFNFICTKLFWERKTV